MWTAHAFNAYLQEAASKTCAVACQAGYGIVLKQDKGMKCLAAHVPVPGSDRATTVQDARSAHRWGSVVRVDLELASCDMLQPARYATRDRLLVQVPHAWARGNGQHQMCVTSRCGHMCCLSVPILAVPNCHLATHTSVREK